MLKPFPFTEREVVLIRSAFFLFSDYRWDDLEMNDPMMYNERAFVETMEIAIGCNVDMNKRELYVILGKYLINRDLTRQ